MNPRISSTACFFAAFFFIFFWTEYFFNDLVLSIGLSFLGGLVCLFPHKKNKTLREDKQAFYNYIALNCTRIIPLLRLLYPEAILAGELLYDGKTAVLPLVGFSSADTDKIVTSARTAVSGGAKELKIVSDNADISTISGLIPLKLTKTTTSAIYDDLSKIDALPHIPSECYLKKRKGTVFNRKSRITYLIVSAIFTSISSLFSPYAIYYLLFATIMLLLALLTATKKTAE